MPRARLLTGAVIALWSALSAAGQTLAPETRGNTAMPGPAPPAEAVNPYAPSTIEGRVVASDTGAPLRGVRVRINGVNTSIGRIVKTAFTDRQGLYRLDGMPPGTYMIYASRPGFVELRQGQKSPLDRVPALWSLPPAETRRLDFALPRGGVISGRLTDESGEPLAGIRLTTLRVAYSPNGERLNPYSAMDSVSDDRGAFRVAGLPPGTYLLLAEHRSDEPGVDLVTTFYPGTHNLREAMRLKVGLSEQVSADFTMLEGPRVRVSGYVRSSDGTPLPQLRIALRATTTSALVRSEFQQGTTGFFDFPGIAPGEYTLDASTTSAGMGGLPNFFNQTEFASVRLSVGTEDLTGLMITTGAGTTVAGRVVFEGTSPRTFTKAYAYAEILDGPPGMRPPSRDNGNGEIAEDGSFTMKGGYGKMLFRVGVPGWQVQSVMVDGVDITDVPYDASRGDLKNVEIVVTDRRQELSGTVGDALGKPVSRYAVVVFPSDLPEGAVPGRFIRVLSPREDGTFGINNLPAGRYFAAAVETMNYEAQWDPAFREALQPRATPFHLSPGQTTTLRLSLVE